MKTGEGGVATPYDLNITWWSALNDAAAGQDLERQGDRLVAARAIALLLRGVPGIYLPSFFGARNELEAVWRDGQARSINRSVIREEWLFDQFADASSIPLRTASLFIDLLGRRAAEPAFHPAVPQRVLRLDPRLLALARVPAGAGAPVLAIVEVSGSIVEMRLRPAHAGLPEGPLVDLVSGEAIPRDGGETGLRLRPDYVAWLRRLVRPRSRSPPTPSCHGVVGCVPCRGPDARPAPGEPVSRRRRGTRRPGAPSGTSGTRRPSRDS